MHLFVYGTLMDQEIMRLVCKEKYDPVPAELAGYVRKAVFGEVYPAIAPQEGAAVTGLVYQDLSQVAVARIDDFEGALYDRTLVTIRLASTQVVGAHTYVLSPTHLSRLSPDDWSFDEFLQVA